MQLILAIDSDPRRSEQLANLVRARLQVDLVQATSAGEGLHALKDRVPDLILTSPLLSPFDDGVLDEYLRDLGAAAMHVQTVRIPMLSSGPKKKSAANRLFSLGRKKMQTSPAAPDGCDPKIFADEIAHYLTRSLEERSASAKATADKSDTAQATAFMSDSAKATADTSDFAQAMADMSDFAKAAADTSFSSDATATTGYTLPAWLTDREPGAFEQIVDDWNVPDAIVQEFNETHADWSADAEANAAPEPVAEDSYVPGSILDLRPAATKPRGEAGRAATKPRGEAGLAAPKLRGEAGLPPPKTRAEAGLAPAKLRSEDGTAGPPAPQRVVAAEPELHALIDPDPIVEPEFITPQDVDAYIRPVVAVEPAPPMVSPPVMARPVTAPPVTAAPVIAPAAAPQPPVMAAPVIAPPPASQPPATVAAPAPAASTSGNSASFEAALAAIRAAWAKPESTTTTATTPRTAAPAPPVTANPLDGSGEVDLTDQMDAHQDVTRSKTDRSAKRPEKSNERRTSAAEHRDGGVDGRSDWKTFDPGEYEMSALVNTLEEVTDSKKVTTRATNRR